MVLAALEPWAKISERLRRIFSNPRMKSNPGGCGDEQMNIETLRELCRSLPAVTEDVKWGHDLCFSVAGKMFCVAALDGPLTVSFKVRDDEFDDLSSSPGFK